MRFLVVSDIHSDFSKLKKILESDDFDIVLIAGDITNFRASDILIVDKIVGKHCSECFAVHGNCDPEEMLRYSLDHITFIHSRSVKLPDFTIHGIGGSTYTPFATPSEYSEEQIERFTKNFEFSDFNILLTHCPPKGILDKTYNGENAGSEAIRKILNKFDVVFCGHIHEAYGVERVGNTIVINTGPVIWGRYVIFDFKKFSIEFKSIRIS